ncbi:MAG: hypothetical protein JSV86_16510 [Gemmatimonadota bacterium]|nr:MAG: hypothetical protein JSV86_16510 [Gemmatimonadota bacterium]
MTPLIWALIAVLGLIVFGLGLRSFVMGGFPDSAPGGDEEGRADVPMAPQQRRAWWGLGIGLVMSVAILAVFIAKGPWTYYQDRGMRLLVLALFGVWLVAYFVMRALTGAKAGESEVVMDERDRLIQVRALSVSLVAVFLVLAAYAIGLTELYWEEKAIPIDAPYHTLWSAIVVGVLAREAGILMGYAGWHSRGES